ncbi:hypothetical protein [Candidatus Viadribacter manganicus]|uniref:Uncharacterized protein n=1 Tax=Candidatus Viadribacter manganicus TaxID=1759059 RepID=A0A1B1AGK4_9PROT|nr:hypothetical protein [Candidatus Viadribacter manganicus]ANP45684.1 hypothetical protein ATE48_06990 [Candidatus Viadribacter manganicus]
MKARVLAVITGLVLSAMVSTPARADEVWALPSGNQLTYDRDVGNVAVLTYRAEQGLNPGQIFVVGLGGQYEGRRSYQAYWVEADDAGPACAASLVDAEGRTWRRWGLARVAFASPSFPSRLTLSRGECLNGPSGRIVARPVVGAGVR